MSHNKIYVYYLMASHFNTKNPTIFFNTSNERNIYSCEVRLCMKQRRRVAKLNLRQGEIGMKSVQEAF